MINIFSKTRIKPKKQRLTLQIGKELKISSDIMASSDLVEGNTVELNELDIEMFRFLLNETEQIKIDFSIKQKMAANILAASKFIEPSNVNGLDQQPGYSVFWAGKQQEKQIGLMNRLDYAAGGHIVIPTSYNPETNQFVCVSQRQIINNETGRGHRVVNIHERRLISDYRLVCPESCMEFAQMD